MLGSRTQLEADLDPDDRSRHPAVALPSWADASSTPPVVDALVIGGGPAGLSAATWLGRYRRRTLLVDAGWHRNRAVDAVHGLLGRDPVPPGTLREDALRGLAAYPHVSLRHGTVTRLERAGDGFEAAIGDEQVRASRVVLATGVRDLLPDVEGVLEHYGAGVQHCPTCEGFETRDQPVVVLGWGDHVPGFATELLDWASEVAVVSDGRRMEITDDQRRRLQDLGIAVVDRAAARLIGPRGRLTAVELEDGVRVPARFVFFSIGHRASVDLAVHLGCELTADGVIAVDEQQRTTVPGAYAAGDVTPGMQLVAVALGEGTVAGVACAQSLQGEPTAPGAPPAAPDPHVVDP